MWIANLVIPFPKEVIFCIVTMFNCINIYLQKTYLIDTCSPTEKYYVYHSDIKTTMYNINSHLKPLMCTKRVIYTFTYWKCSWLAYTYTVETKQGESVDQTDKSRPWPCQYWMTLTTTSWLLVGSPLFRSQLSHLICALLPRKHSRNVQLASLAVVCFILRL